MPPLWKSIQSFFTDRPESAPWAVPLDVPVVGIVKSGEDRNLLQNIGRRDHLHFHFSESCGEAWNAANLLRSPVVLCERDLPGMEWQDAVRILASAVMHPCVILISNVIDDYLWKEIVARGGYAALAAPLRDDDATRSLKLALSWWKSTSKGNTRLSSLRK